MKFHISHAIDEVAQIAGPKGDVANRWNVRISHIVDGDGFPVGSIVQTLRQILVEFVLSGAVKWSWNGWCEVARVGG